MRSQKCSGSGHRYPRASRTREALDAVIELIHQQLFFDITLQQVRDLAHVSRSTFYTHFVDDHDRLYSDVEQSFEFISA